MKTVTIYSTRGGVKELNTDAQNWGELKTELINNFNYDFENLTATEGLHKTTLEHVDAVIPNEDFTLFLRPTKFKAGAVDYDKLSFKELRELLTEDDKKILKETHKKNWTQISRTDITEYLKNKSSDNTTYDFVKELFTQLTEIAKNDFGQSIYEKLASVKQKDVEVIHNDDEVNRVMFYINRNNNLSSDKEKNKSQKEDELRAQYEDLISGFDN